MEPMAIVACVSVKGAQVVPPFVVFHTPPGAPPRYTVLTFPGSMASAVTRPETTGALYGVLIGCGPMKVHEGIDAGADCAKSARRAPSSVHFCSSGSNPPP